MKIYTKRGDKGQTDLMMQRVSKADLRISVIGAFDETMAFVLVSKHYIRTQEVHDIINHIHQILFDINHEIALDDANKTKTTQENVLWMESKIDYFNQFLKPLTKFIKLDQTKAASFLNLARVTIRRAERELITLDQEKPVNIYTLQFVNRLSDFLFTLARYFDEVE
jgi:cob(I)alamin adenosyltransferase